MLFSARIKELEGQLALVNTSLADATQQLGAVTQEKEGLAVQLSEASANLATISTERDTALSNLSVVTAERDSAIVNLQSETASRDATISAQVTKRIAAAGVDPIKRDPQATQNSTLSLAEFNALTPADRLAFSKRGGKIAE